MGPSVATRRAAAILGLAASALTPACTGIWSRGIVEDSGTRAIGGAEVRVLDASGQRVISTDRTDVSGCFFFSLKPPKGERRFTLEVAAPGYRTVRHDFELETPILIAILASDNETGESEVRPATPAERTDRWGPQCVPPFPPGAQSLGPN
jgi:Carboxypeptidase regulatory-like domain